MPRLSRSQRRSEAASKAAATMLREAGAYTVDPKDDVEVAVVRVARSAASRARRLQLPFDLDLPAAMLQICRDQEARCALSGLPFSMTIHGAGAAPRPFAPSVDRIISGGGYVVGNCRLVIWAVNCLCGTWGADIAIAIARGMVQRNAAPISPAGPPQQASRSDADDLSLRPADERRPGAG